MGRLSIGNYLNLHLLDDDLSTPARVDYIREFNGPVPFPTVWAIVRVDELQWILLQHKENKYAQETSYDCNYANLNRRVV